MIADSKNHTVQIYDTDQIGKIAACLSDNFVKPLFDFRDEKNYPAYVKSLAKILNWSHEFYKQYHHKLKDWEAFEKSTDNIYDAVNPNDFLIAWGQKRIKQFFAHHTNETGHSGKYTNNNKNKRNNFSMGVAT